MSQIAWFLQYILGGFFALFVSAYIFMKGSSEKKTWALKGFFVFGLLIAVWEFATYFQRTAPSPELSAIFFYIILISSSLSQPTYLITALNIQRQKPYFLLIFIPAIIRLVTFLFVNITFQMTDYGWTYELLVSGIPLEIGTAIYFGYYIATIVILFGLARKARSSTLKKKYWILLAGYTLFQVIGFTVTNYFLTIDHNFAPVGGILQFLTFITIGFAFSLKETKLPSQKSAIIGFPEVYSSFLTNFYNMSTDTNLGEASFKFLEFLKKSLIADKVSIGPDGISFEAPDDSKMLEVINHNLNFLEEEKNSELTDSYLRVLNSAHLMLGDSFDKVVMKNIEFLKKSDLVYGISNGDYLRRIDEDRTLNKLSDVEACLKIYKRLLLAVSDKISLHDFQNKLAIYQSTKSVKVTKYGEISIEATKEEIIRLPKEQRLSAIIESFTPLTSWIYSRLISNSYVGDAVLESLKHVLRLNREPAIELRVYPTLLERLAAKVPQGEIEQLYNEYLEELIELKSDELQEVRDRLIEAERLSAIGRTTAMVGHDLRNPLQAIVNTIHLARMKLELIPPQIEKQDLEQIYDKIEGQVLYMDKIVTDLQDFSRKINLKKVPINVQKLIDEVLSSISIPGTINVSVDTKNESPLALADYSSMKRVFDNLVRNAIQAMPDGGNLKIGTKSSDKEITVIVEDTGVGIPEDYISKIFEPFFTTKAQGQGLGLSICKKFVEANGGSIEVESTEGKGTIFTVKLSRV
ncbi:MAG: ATP-binding protein [Candidatus Bathyarchaeum tardum]|nr:MAG: ATP-binding protein [Candidatus Bathyarchaeum tardum]